MEPKLPRNPHPTDSLKFFKRFPWVATFEERLNQEPFVVADRLWVKDHLNPDEEKLRFSK